MNTYDGDKMSDVLLSIGFNKSQSLDDADFVILNTCHIREKASAKVYSDLGRLSKIKMQKKDEGKDFIIAVAGCTAQAEGKEILKNAPFVDLIFGPQTYHRLPEMLEKLKRKTGIKVIDLDFPIESKFDFLVTVNNSSRVSEFLSIQEGCDKFCTFCCVPYTRGPEYSRPVNDIIKEAEKLVENGCREITLLGQNVTAYHGLYENHEVNIAFLIDKLSKIDQLQRIRYTTSHPRDINDDLIRAHGKVDKLQPFLHLPVQSGSNTVLKHMNRKHTIDLYIDIIDKLRNVCPNIAFSSDFIVGYPTETEEDFDMTLKLVERVYFAQAYSFAYSPRPGTPASILPQLSHDVKFNRLYRLQNLLNAQQLEFNNSFLNKELSVLIEQIGKDNTSISGKSQYMQTVHIDMPNNWKEMIGKTLYVRITDVYKNSMRGEIT